MKRAQIFTLDLLLGTIIITSVITSGYFITSSYLSTNQSFSLSTNVIGTASSAVSAFAFVNSTSSSLLKLENGGNSFNFINYSESILKSEVTEPFFFEVFQKTTYTTGSVPNSMIVSYRSPTFSNSSSSSVFYEPLIISNMSSLCGNSCNYSLYIGNVFPSENASLNAPECTVSNGAGVSPGWKIFNNTASGCIIEVSANADPNNYLVKAYSSSGSSEGETTLHVFSINLIEIGIEG